MMQQLICIIVMAASCVMLGWEARDAYDECKNLAKRDT